MPEFRHYNPIGTVHGGFAATLLDSALGCAIFSTLAKGEAWTTLELKLNFVRPMSKDTGTVRAEGRIIHRGRTVATSEGTVKDRAGKLYAHATDDVHDLSGQEVMRRHGRGSAEDVMRKHTTIARIPQPQDRADRRGHARALAKTKRAAVAARLSLRKIRSDAQSSPAEARTPRSRYVGAACKSPRELRRLKSQ